MKHILVILFLFFFINLEAQEQAATFYKDFKKNETVKITDNSRLSKYIGKSNGAKLALALAAFFVSFFAVKKENVKAVK